MNKFLKGSLITLVIVLNTILVYRYAPGIKQFFAFSSYNEIAPTTEQVSPELIADIAEPNPIQTQVDKSEPVSLIPISKSNRGACELAFVGSSCMDKLKQTQKKQIYTWIDANGIRHLSDSPRPFDASIPVELAGVIEPENIAVNFVGSKGSQKLRQAIASRVKKSKAFYEQVLPASLVKPITINIRLIDDEADYKNYLTKVAPRSLSSQGVYIASLNESVVWVKSEDQAIRTASHEAMHSMNRHWIGQMGRWLNEGLAEVAEDFENLSGQNANPLPFEKLINASKENWSTNPDVHYASAKAHVGRLFVKDKKGLARLLLAESENGCDELSFDEINTALSYKL